MWFQIFPRPEISRRSTSGSMCKSGFARVQNLVAKLVASRLASWERCGQPAAFIVSMLDVLIVKNVTWGADVSIGLNPSFTARSGI